MSVTLRDIARRAHVSTSTVSRALRDYPHVSDATRETVIQAAQALNYPMDNLRRTSEDVRTVLVLIRDRDWQANQDVRSVDVDGFIAFGAQSVLRERGISARVQSDRMAGEGIGQYTADPSVAGLILASGVVGHDFIRGLQAADLPFVVAGSHVRPLCANCVMADYAGGAVQAVDHLIARGRRRIGLVNGPSTTTSSEEKHRGFRLALSLHDMLATPLQTVVCEEFSSECGYAQTLQLLSRMPDLDAIVYASDGIAMGGLRALRESGRRVPNDVAITGFYDYELARFTDPPLTTVHTDLQAMGAIAARRLCMMLDEPDDQGWCVTVPTSLVVRGST
jgi:DNA-binding LacI/PurR family transcriptional regulator